jgi:hypothetical protein
MPRQVQRIANRLLQLTDNHRTWGFMLCFLSLRNVRGFGWSHKRVYRIYRELALNLQLKPRKRLVRQVSGLLAEPTCINEVWFSLPTQRVVKAQTQIIEQRCRPLLPEAEYG